MSGKVPEVLRGRESEVGLGGPWSAGRAAEQAHPEAIFLTFSIELRNERITSDTDGRSMRLATHTPAVSLRHARGGGSAGPGRQLSQPLTRRAREKGAIMRARNDDDIHNMCHAWIRATYKGSRRELAGV